jgi:catechol 2,3-dioxygenase-like lactoylglutathione lyase family enzyme
VIGCRRRSVLELLGRLDANALRPAVPGVRRELRGDQVGLPDRHAAVALLLADLPSSSSVTSTCARATSYDCWPLRPLGVSDGRRVRSSLPGLRPLCSYPPRPPSRKRLAPARPHTRRDRPRRTPLRRDRDRPRDRRRVELIEYEPVGDDRRGGEVNDPGATHLGLSTDDLDAFYAGLPADVETISEPQTTASGARICFFRDPDGNLVEVLEG